MRDPHALGAPPSTDVLASPRQHVAALSPVVLQAAARPHLPPVSPHLPSSFPPTQSPILEQVSPDAALLTSFCFSWPLG